jgi:lysophospholipase L1-like esterase
MIKEYIVTKTLKCFVVTIAVLISCPVCIVSSEEESKVQYPDPHRFDNEIKAFQEWDSKNSFPKDAILFVGSSSIRFWKTAESFFDLPVINRGFGGSYAADALFLVNETVLKYKPKLIVIYEGDNDIAGSIPPRLVHEDLVKLTNTIHEKLPEAQIICLAAKICSSRWHLREAVIQLNYLNKQYAEMNDYLTFVDISKVLLNAEGLPIDELFIPDKLHLNDRGYARWSALLSPVLIERYAIAMNNEQ